jgi:hypothetical protein
MTDPTTRDLIAWWRMEETGSADRVDSHDNSLDLTSVFAPPNDTGIQGNAVDLDGTEEVLYHVDDALLSMGGDISFTIGLWFKAHSIITDDMVILSKWDEGGDQEYLITQDAARVKFTIRNAAGTTSHSVRADTFGNLSNNTWYFLVCYYNASTNWMWIGINDVFTAATSSSTGVRDDTNRLYFGREVDGSFPHYNGLIDEVFIYRDRLLSTAEKTWLYNSGSGRTYSDISYMVDLTAVDTDSAAPILGTPALAQVHALNAVDITANPVLGLPSAIVPPLTKFTPLLTDETVLVHVLNSQRNVMAVIEDYYSLNWAERYSDVGDFELELPIEYGINSSIAFGNFLRIAASDKLMLIEDIKPSFGEEQTSLLVRGRSVECLLGRRVLLDDINVEGVAETTIYALIADNITNPVDSSRGMTLFKSTFPSVSTTVEFEEQLEMQNLYNAVKTICKNTNLGFKIVLEEDGKLAFSVYEGEDRSYDQGTNPYVIFSDDFDNVIESSFYESIKDKKNITLVATDDTVEALQRVFVWEATEPTDINRYESLLETTITRDIDGDPLSDAEVLAIITTRGIQEIKENNFVGLFEGDFDIQGNFKYGVDFFMGDIVQCNLQERNVKARVIELVRSYSEKGEKAYVAMDFII